MGPIGHIAAAAGMGATVWVVTGSALAVPAALAAGVLVDLDHLVDFLDSRENGHYRHMLRPFHAWEYSGALLALALLPWFFHPIFLAAVLGYLSHMLLDQVVNRVHPLAYFIIYRASHGFRRRQLTPHLFNRPYLYPEQVPWWGKLEPSVWKMVVRWRGLDR